MRSQSWMRAVLLMSLAVLLSASVLSQPEESLFDALKWRSVGPAGAGGRVVDLAVTGDFPHHIFVATATGGLWKTDNNGVTWTPIFDHESTSSVGAVAVHPANPDVIWVGTGEANARNSVSWGHGVFKSSDGGKTWKNMGLRDTQHIGRVRIHPNDPNTVWVAALGHVWGPNSERGVFKTSDGGETWEKSLSINNQTGVVDLAMDPRDPHTLYAAAYQVQRDGFAGGNPAIMTGPGSGLYKTTDGGRNWKELESGLPKSDKGRIGLSISQSSPNIVYAIVQTETSVGRGGFGAPSPRRRTAEDGGIFRSEDRGETWTWVNELNPRPFYYSQIRVDPQDSARIYVLGSSLAVSEDGGQNFENQQINVHVDHHALWINPQNSDHLVLGNDGGIYFSFDRGRSWDFLNQMAIGQFYAIDVDMRKPYYIYGGVQDYCSWGGPSATRNEVGITAGDWYKVMTGDGFQVRIDPTDHTTLYAEMQGGGLIRHDLKSGLNTSIKPESGDPDNGYRFNWESPILISPHDHNTLYMGANLVLKSTNRGDDWEAISEDLTEATEPVDDDSEDSDEPSEVRKIGSLTTLSESPIKAGLIYAGSDDGLVHVTRDGGKSWTNLTERFSGLSGRRWVSRVVASKFSECRAFVSFDGHRSDDYAPHLYRTEDCGERWTNLTSNLPDHGSVRVVREDTEAENLLFVGTEFALLVSLDGGAHWTRFMSGLPTVPIADLVVHPRDGELVAGTHGRSAWVVDIKPLREMSQQMLARDFHLFDTHPVPAFQYRVHSDDQFLAEKRFIADNPEYGAAITYYLKEDFKPERSGSGRGATGGRRGGRGGGGNAASEPQLEIALLDSQGKEIRKLNGPSSMGLHRVYWDLRSEGPRMGNTGRRGGRGGGAGPLVEPGSYTVQIQAPGGEQTGRIVVEADPEVDVSDSDRRFRRQTMDDLIPVISLGAETQSGLETIATQLSELETQLDGVEGQDELLEQVKALKEQIEEKTEALNTASRSLGGAYGSIRDSPFRPTGTQTAAIAKGSPVVRETANWVNAFIEKEMNDLERRLRRSDLPRLKKVEAVKVP